MKTNQEWKPVTGFESFYEVSNNGIVRSLDRYRQGRSGGRMIPGKVLKQANSHGYPFVTLYSEKSRKVFRVHRLVAIHFVKGNHSLIVNHIDGNKANNHSGNLEWVTHQENYKHATNKLNVGANKNGRNAKSIFDEFELLTILTMNNYSSARMSRYYNCALITIYQIRKRMVYQNMGILNDGICYSRKWEDTANHYQRNKKDS